MNRTIEVFKQFVTENRFELFQKVLAERTRYITVVLEDIYQSQNAGAVLRTCDCFGVHDVHIIENRNEFQINPDVTLGSSKWLELIRYNQYENNSSHAIQTLKQNGYRIIATSPHAQGYTPDSFDVTKGKFALMFGSEKPGLSKIALEQADEFLKIPMYGFTESFNISVSAAIILSALSQKIRNSSVDYSLSEGEYEEIMISWLKNNIKDPAAIEEKLLKGEL